MPWRLGRIRMFGRFRFRRRRSGGWLSVVRSAARAGSAGDGGTARIAWIDGNRRCGIDRRARTRRRLAVLIFAARARQFGVLRRLAALSGLGRRDLAHDFVGRVCVRVADDPNRDGAVVGLARRRRLREYRRDSGQEHRSKDQLPITTHAMFRGSSEQGVRRAIIRRRFRARCQAAAKNACRRLLKNEKRAGDCSPAPLFIGPPNSPSRVAGLQLGNEECPHYAFAAALRFCTSSMTSSATFFGTGS